jgi:hypothetical protein
MTRLLPIICKQTGISLIRVFPRTIYSTNRSKMNPDEAKKFLSLLDGELAPLTGVRLESALDVTPKVLSRFEQ